MAKIATTKKAKANKAKANKVIATKPAMPADVESYKHKEAKRKNIPTAENQKLVAEDDKALNKLRWPRNPDLDPQLVWRGKDFEPDPLEADVPPIYIQEKIKPQAIIEDLRRQAKERNKERATQFDFFSDFNGLPEGWKENATASYYHDEGEWSNRMILATRCSSWPHLQSAKRCAERCNAYISTHHTGYALHQIGSHQQKAFM